MPISGKGLIAGVVSLIASYAIWQALAVAFGRNVDPQSSSALLLIDLMGLVPFLAFAVSGFLAARAAGTAGLLHGLAVAVVGCGLFFWYSIAELLSGRYSAPMHLLVMSVIAGVLAGGVGELYARRARA